MDHTNSSSYVPLNFYWVTNLNMAIPLCAITGPVKYTLPSEENTTRGVGSLREIQDFNIRDMFKKNR